MHTNGLHVRIENRYMCSYCGVIKEALAYNKIEIA